MIQHKSSRVYCAILIILCLTQTGIASDCPVLPAVKQWTPSGNSLLLRAASIQSNDPDLANEVAILREMLKDHQVTLQNNDTNAIPIHLKLQPLALPIQESDYQATLLNQGYELSITKDDISILANHPEGIFYAIQTLRQLIDSEQASLSCGTLRDWPDLPVRMIMLDLARQMEHPDYINRVIDFCARYKINGLHLHLSDDQNLCLYHEDYPSIQHPRALREKQVQQLVQKASRYHINIIPEIESLGHSRLFIRHPKAGEILHQAPAEKTVHAIPGYTNVLCPASPLAHKYLDDMYRQCSRLFPYDTIHIGCDEVHLTGCKRCDDRFPDTSPEQRFMNHLQECAKLAAKYDRQIGIWDDMFWHTWKDTTFNISMEEIRNQLPPENTIIYSWHYYKVPEEIPARFKSGGYRVIACPSLLCWGHMIFPDPKRLQNIRDFARIARNQDLYGLDATIWLPQRYLTNTMWIGMAYTADQAWAGSTTSDATFFSNFMKQFYGSDDGPRFTRIWYNLESASWFGRTLQHRAIWYNNTTLTQTADIARKYNQSLQTDLQKLADSIRQANEITPSISRHKDEWQSFIHALEIASLSIQHVLAAPAILNQEDDSRNQLETLDAGCRSAIQWVETDWDRNRYPDDQIGKDDFSALGPQHLLHTLRLARKFNAELLNRPIPTLQD